MAGSASYAVLWFHAQVKFVVVLFTAETLD